MEIIGSIVGEHRREEKLNIVLHLDRKTLRALTSFSFIRGVELWCQRSQVLRCSWKPPSRVSFLSQSPHLSPQSQDHILSWSWLLLRFVNARISARGAGKQTSLPGSHFQTLWAAQGPRPVRSATGSHVQQSPLYPQTWGALFSHPKWSQAVSVDPLPLLLLCFGLGWPWAPCRQWFSWSLCPLCTPFSGLIWTHLNALPVVSP